MEMKYLREQDTHQIYLPVVHVNGIVGLDVSASNTKSIKEINIIDELNPDITGVVRFIEYNKIVYSDLEISIDYSLLDSSNYQKLLRGNTITLDLPTDSLKNYTYLTYDTVVYDESSIISPYIDMGITYSNGVLSIVASLRNNKYSVNPGTSAIENHPEDFQFSKVVGSAVGMII